MDQFQSRVLNLDTMPPDDLAALLKDLYPFHDSIFDGVDERAFEKAMLNPHAQLNKIKLFTDKSGRICAYCAVHRADFRLADKPASVFKVEIAVSRENRGRALCTAFVVKELLLHFLRQPLRRTYFLSALVHPASYRLVTGIFWRLYPSWKYPTPPDIEQLMNEIADRLDYERSELRPWTRRVGWITRDNDRSRNYWLNHESPEIRYFLKRNPDYVHGFGLLSIMPFTLVNVVMSVVFWQHQRIVRLLGSSRRTLEFDPPAAEGDAGR